MLRQLIYEVDTTKGYRKLGYETIREWFLATLPDAVHVVQLYRELYAARIERDLGLEIGSTRESHLRPLNPLSAEDRRAAFAAARAAAEKEGRALKGSDVEKAAAQFRLRRILRDAEP